MSLELKRTASTLGDLHAYYEQEIREGRTTEAAATSEFAALLMRGIKIAMDRGHKVNLGVASGIWDRQVSEKGSNESEEFSGVGKLNGTNFDVVLEQEEFPRMGFTHDRARIPIRKFGGAVEFSRELLRGDKTGRLNRMAESAGEVAALRKDKVFVDKYFNNYSSTTIYNGQAVFSNNHPNVTGSGTNSSNDNLMALGSVTRANMESVRQEVADWRDMNGEIADVEITDMYLASNQIEEALRVVGSTAHPETSFSSGVKNVQQGFATLHEWKRLSATTWYIKTNVPGLVMLEGEGGAGLQIERMPDNTGDAFWRDLAGVFKLRDVWGHGVTDWRWGAKCA